MVFVYECACGLWRNVTIYHDMIGRELVTRCDRCGRERVFSASERYAHKFNKSEPERSEVSVEEYVEQLGIKKAAEWDERAGQEARR